MTPYEALTEKDFRIIENYIDVNAVSKEFYCGNEAWLKNWDKSNRKLFQLLGEKLIVKYPFSYQKTREELEEELYQLCHRYNIEYFFFNLFIDELYNIQNGSLLFHGLNVGLSTNAWVTSIKESIIHDDTILNDMVFSLEGKKDLKIPKGSKPIKALQKILKYFNLDGKLHDDFEKFRLKHSLILNEKNIKGNLVLSIHPVDYMTMSDNANNWSSCMSWKRNGCYSVGTIEMMNSNNVICAYIESNSSFVFDEENGENGIWNSKKWRQLVYVTKEIIVSGKPYPYKNNDISKNIIEYIRELAKENLNWNYKYGIEEYKDMKHINGIDEMYHNKNWIHYGDTIKHNIIFDTKGMYNDMVNDSTTQYFCVRNKVKHNKIINISGKTNCLCCNNEIISEEDYDVYDYNERFSDVGSLVCWACIDVVSCDSCRSLIKKDNFIYVDEQVYCKDCYDELMKECPCCGGLFKLPVNNSYDRKNSIICFLNSENQVTLNRETIYYNLYGNNSSYKPTEFKKSLNQTAVPLYMCLDCKDKKVLENKFKFVHFPSSYDYTYGKDDLFCVTADKYDAADPKITKYLLENLKTFPVEKLN